MKILIDFVHMADVNFYKHAIQKLKKHELVFTVMDRGKLPEVVTKEIGKAHVLGSHASLGVLKPAYNLRRVYLLRKFIKKHRPDVVTCFGYYPAAAAKGLAKSVIFHDDPEYRSQFFLCRTFADSLVVPDILDVKADNVKTYHGYKEWAYLNPNYFSPKKDVLRRLGLEENRFVFIREVASMSLNYAYASDMREIIEGISGKKIVSSENGRRYKDCVMLEPPVEDFHSLIYYAKAVITSGDTMAREAALLGVPSIYVGGRDMKINKKLIEDGRITLARDMKSIKKALGKKRKYPVKGLDDTTKVIVRQLHG